MPYNIIYDSSLLFNYNPETMSLYVDIFQNIGELYFEDIKEKYMTNCSHRLL